MNTQEEIKKEYNNQQIKLKYYLIALCVTSIGYSIVRTTGKSVDCLDIPLGIAVALWAISIYLGFHFLKCFLATLKINDAQFNVHKGIHPVSKDDPRLIAIADETLKRSLNRIGRMGSLANQWQEILFYAGMIMFILWHVLDILY